MMPVFTDWRIATCPVHGIRFNSEESDCADCRYDARRKPMPSAAPHRWAGMMKFRCPFCGGKSIRSQGCSKYRCGVQSGLYALKPLNRCRHCGNRTKYPAYCTNYPCRKVAGTIGMYYRRSG
jgi:hypothetical protein